jgi:hypothetical protein
LPRDQHRPTLPVSNWGPAPLPTSGGKELLRGRMGLAKMELPRPNGSWRRASLSLAAGVALLTVIIMAMVLMPISPLLPTPERPAEYPAKPVKPH